MRSSRSTHASHARTTQLTAEVFIDLSELLLTTCQAIADVIHHIVVMITGLLAHRHLTKIEHLDLGIGRIFHKLVDIRLAHG